MRRKTLAEVLAVQQGQVCEVDREGVCMIVSVDNNQYENDQTPTQLENGPKLLSSSCVVLCLV